MILELTKNRMFCFVSESQTEWVVVSEIGERLSKLGVRHVLDERARSLTVGLSLLAHCCSYDFITKARERFSIEMRV